jgi:hypothetical protein
MDKAFFTTGAARALIRYIILLNVAIVSMKARGQDLEPRAYIRVPIKVNVILSGFSYSKGKVLTDPSVPLKDFKANVEAFTLGYARTFKLFGKTAQAFAAVPFCFAKATASVNGQFTSVNRTGTADIRARISILLLGGKAYTMSEFVKQKKPRTILGTSLTVQVPTGQYFPDKLVNLGSGRWAFKPEIALSESLGKRWLLDLYTAAWLFTNNNSYFTGDAVRSQEAIGSVQSHISYNLGPFSWAAFNATYYYGGTSTVNGVKNDDQVSNFRVGATLALKTGKKSGLKLAFSKGAVVTRGSNFTTFSVGWNYSWF